MADESLQQPSLEEWEAQRELITRLYSTKKLKYVMMEMESQGFKASEAVYKKRFRQWGIRKNMSAERALEIFKRKRESESGDAPRDGNGNVLIGGNGDSDENIARHIKRLKARGVDVDGYVSSSLTPGLDRRNSSSAPNPPTTGAVASPTPSVRLPVHGVSSISLSQPSFLHPTRAFTPSYNIGALSSSEARLRVRPAGVVVGEQPRESMPLFLGAHDEASDVAAFKALMNDLFYIDNSQQQTPRSPVSPHFSDDEIEVVEISSGQIDCSSKSNEPTDAEAVQMQPIHHATLFGRLSAVELLLRTQPSCVNATAHEGISPLWLAARGNFVDVAWVLVRAGADLNARCGDQQNTPLIEAVVRGNYDMVRFLIQEANVDPDQGNKQGLTPLCVACYKGSIDVTKALIKGGADVNQATRSLRTPLHMACVNRNTKVLDILLESGAAVDVRDSRGSTPLRLAVEEGNPDAVRLLLYHNADPNIPEHEGSASPLHHAVGKDHSEIVEWLLDHGADPNATTSSGWSPLMEACSHGNVNIVRLLLQHKANVNYRIEKGIAPLHVAAIEGHTDVVDALLDRGAHPLYPEGDAHPINLAAGNGHLDTVKVLVQRGADVNSKTCQEKFIITPLCAAAQNDHVPVMEYLIEQGALM
ncbi:hypothetical protein ACJZ2D_005969 [Fusarium nematophilum]